MSSLATRVEHQAGELAAELAARGAEGCRLALVLGSGLGGVADALDEARTIPFEELSAMPKSGVPGHAGRFVVGRFGGVRCLVQQGRIHLYEGHSVHAVTRSVRAFAKLGIEALFLTNAAGSMHAAWPPGTLMRLTDHLNLQGRAPVLSAERARGSPYDPALGEALHQAANETGIPLERGVYLGLLGPSYESAGEIRSFATLGADAVGMSTVAEASVAAVSGMRVAAVSCLTNLASGIGDQPLSHDEVIEVGARIGGDFQRLLERWIPTVPALLSAS